MSDNTIHFADNLAVLATLPDGSVPLIYIDPPFNTGRLQTRTRIRTSYDLDGDRVGFQGRTYRTIRIGTSQFNDSFDDYLVFLAPRLNEAHRVLASTGTLYVHLDYREVHYVKIMLDEIFGRGSFLNEIIWAYDYGARTTRKWPPKHDNILVYVKNPNDYVFNSDDIDREPYMAPGLVGPEKAARGKLPTDTWWHTIVPTSGSERTARPKAPLLTSGRCSRQKATTPASIST
jgi:site-specific DNA-methyltransferase (adenine-specific)